MQPWNAQCTSIWGKIEKEISQNGSTVFVYQCTVTVRAPVFGRHQFFGTSEHYGKAHRSLLSGWMNYNYTACCWFPTSSNILILPSQFWQSKFESCWLHCSKCRILVLLRYLLFVSSFGEVVCVLNGWLWGCHFNSPSFIYECQSHLHSTI